MKKVLPAPRQEKSGAEQSASAAKIGTATNGANMPVISFPGPKGEPKALKDDVAMIALVRSALALHEASDEIRRNFQGDQKQELVQLLQDALRANNLATRQYLATTLPAHSAGVGGDNESPEG